MSGQLDGAMQQNNGAIETFTYAMSIVSDRNIKDDVTYVSGEDALAAIKALSAHVKQLESAQNKTVPSRDVRLPSYKRMRAFL